MTEAEMIDPFLIDLARISPYCIKFNNNNCNLSAVFEMKSKSGQYIPVNVVRFDYSEDIKGIYCQSVGGDEYAKMHSEID